MNSNLAAGKDVLSICSKCKDTLAHTIVVMASATTPGKVQCNTCKSVQKFKDPAGPKKAVKKSPSVKQRRAMSAKVSRQDQWEKAFGAASTTEASSKISYSIKTSFKKGDLIDHPTYGMGFVERLIDKNKIEVIFETEAKTLVHNL